MQIKGTTKKSTIENHFCGVKVINNSEDRTCTDAHIHVQGQFRTIIIHYRRCQVTTQSKILYCFQDIKQHIKMADIINQKSVPKLLFFEHTNYIVHIQCKDIFWQTRIQSLCPRKYTGQPSSQFQNVKDSQVYSFLPPFFFFKIKTSQSLERTANAIPPQGLYVYQQLSMQWPTSHLPE